MSHIIFSIGNILVGTYILLLAFKVVKPALKERSPEKYDEWHRKYGLPFKILGSIVLLGGIVMGVNALT